MRNLMLGVDPGVATGVAVWDREARRLVLVTAMAIHDAMEFTRKTSVSGALHSVTFEDARLRRWFGSADARQARSGPGVREGVGSVKRDCAIWQDYLTAMRIPFAAVKPATGATKWDAKTFARVTGWTASTNSHGRDAGVLVFGK